MNEFQSIRDLLTEAPPTDEVKAAGIARLTASRSGRDARIYRLSWKPALGFTAVAAAAAVVITMVAQGSPAPPGQAPSAVQELGASDILLVAAQRQEAQPMGKYWYTNQIQAQSYVIKAKTGTYAIIGATTETFWWTSVKDGGGELFYGRELPAGPLTAADKAAWKRAGSPTRFRVWSSDHYGTYTTGKPGPWRADPHAKVGGGRFQFTGFGRDRKLVPEMCIGAASTADCMKGMVPSPTFKDLLAVDADPRALYKRYAVALADPRLGVTNAQRLLHIGTDLANSPLPPKLRAGILRTIPLLPGVTRIDNITDPLGRKGFAFVADRGGASEAHQPYGSRTELLFDADGNYLGNRDVLTRPAGIYKSQRPGFVINSWIVRSAGWSDTKLKPPVKTAY